MSQRIPTLPDPPANLPPEVRQYLASVVAILRAQFTQLANPSEIGAKRILVPISKFPTQADLATLRSGHVYQDTTASNVLKVKP